MSSLFFLKSNVTLKQVYTHANTIKYDIVIMILILSYLSLTSTKINISHGCELSHYLLTLVTNTKIIPSPYSPREPFHTLMSSLVVLSPQPLKERIHPAFLTTLTGSSSSSSFFLAFLLSASATAALDHNKFFGGPGRQ